MRRASFEISPGDAYVYCPVRFRDIPVDACLDCPWIEDLDTASTTAYLRCSPPGFWPLRLPVEHAMDDATEPEGA